MKPAAKKSGLLSWGLGAALVASLALYVFTKFFLFAFAALAAFLALVFIDIAPEKWDKKSLVHAGKEVAIAIGAALAIWVILCLVLQTSSPIDVVTSCSMVPVLERGDLIVVQGGQINAPGVNFSGSLPQMYGRKSPCTIERDGTPSSALCTSAITVNNQSFGFNSSNDVIVYQANPSSYGLIVHRAWLALHDETGKTFFVTKGDNNQVIDYEGGIQFPERSEVHGKVLARIPYVGLLKLFLFGQFEEPQGCKIRVSQ